MKKKKQIKELKRVFNVAVRRNFDLLKENAELRDADEEHRRLYAALSDISRRHAERVEALKEENAKLRDVNNYMDSAGTIAKLKEENEKLKLANIHLNYRVDDLRESFESAQSANKKLRTENDIAKMQLQDAQEKMRKPVFVPIK